MQFGFRHSALEPEHQSIVEQARMINPVGIADEGVGDATQVEQAIPVGIVARQARDLQSQYDADLPESDLGGHAREAGTLASPEPETPRSSSTMVTCRVPNPSHGAVGQ